MAQLGEFVIDGTKEEKSFDPLPAGEYKAIIESSELVDIKDNKGKMLKLTYKVIDGTFSGRKVFENLCIGHVNEKPREIAKTALNAIGKALDMNVIKDSAQLHNQPMWIKVKMTPAKDGYDQGNNISKHTSTKVGPSAPAEVSAGSAPDFFSQKGSESEFPSSSGKAPWEI